MSCAITRSVNDLPASCGQGKHLLFSTNLAVAGPTSADTVAATGLTAGGSAAGCQAFQGPITQQKHSKHGDALILRRSFANTVNAVLAKHISPWSCPEEGTL